MVRVAVEPWPELLLESWQDTKDTLHLWSQLPGKVRLALSPFVNHWWHVALYVNARGLTTGAIPAGDRTLELAFDFVDHALVVKLSDGQVARLELVPRTVADFHGEVLALLRSLDVRAWIDPRPQEIPGAIPFDRDRLHGSYDRPAVERFFQVPSSAERALELFRSGFRGKCSPVHFFWGSFDLCVTRFSGRRAPERPGADRITREAYSHEVHSVGFWPGGGVFPEPAFYAYMSPEPAGFDATRVRPAAAFYHQGLKEFLLPYEFVRRARSPRGAVLEFARSTYEAGATLARWDRPALEVPVTICRHLDQVHVTGTETRVCEECVKLGSPWVHLRLCLSCGHVGCCDSSPNRHATAHFRASGHPLIRSAEPGETWGWCYVDELELAGSQLTRRAA